jgi:hypothetical protein
MKHNLHELDDQIKKNEMVGACGTYETQESHTRFWWGDQRKRDHLEDPGFPVTITLKRIFKWDRAWTGFLTQDRNRWRALVDAVIISRFP